MNNKEYSKKITEIERDLIPTKKELNWMYKTLYQYCGSKKIPIEEKLSDAYIGLKKALRTDDGIFNKKDHIQITVWQNMINGYIKDHQLRRKKIDKKEISIFLTNKKEYTIAEEIQGKENQENNVDIKEDFLYFSKIIKKEFLFYIKEKRKVKRAKQLPCLNEDFYNIWYDKKINSLRRKKIGKKYNLSDGQIKGILENAYPLFKKISQKIRDQNPSWK